MAVIRKQNDIPDILPLMNGQDTSLLYINEDVHKIKSRYRDSNFDSVKSNRSMSLYDPETTEKLKGDEEMTMSHETYDESKGTDNVKATYSEVITPRKFSMQDKPFSGSSGNLDHGSQATANGDISHLAKETKIAVEAKSPQQSTVSSVAHTNLNSMNGNMQEGNERQPMANGNVSIEHVEMSTEMSHDGLHTGSLDNSMSPSDQDQSKRTSPNDDISTERVTQRSTTIKKSGSFQIRSSLNSDSYHSESSSKGTSIEGSGDITVPTSEVKEEAQYTSNQEIRRHSSRASSKDRQGSRPASTSSNSAPSYMKDTNSSQAKRSSRTSERSPSAASDKPQLHRATSKTSSSGSRPPSGQVSVVRTSVASSRRPNSSSSQSPPPSPNKAGGSSRSSSARRSEASVRRTSPSPNRNSMVSSRSSSVKRSDSFSRETPPSSPTKVSGTPPRTPSITRSDGYSVQSSPTSSSMAIPPVRTSSQKSNSVSVSRNSSASKEGRPRKPSQDYTSPERDSSASVAAIETSATRTSVRNSIASSVSSKPPSRTPSATSKPPSGSTQVSRQSSQKLSSSYSNTATPTTSRTNTQERGVGKFVMKHGAGTDGEQGDSSANTSTTVTKKFPTPSATSEEFELNANILASQKAQLKTNGYSPKPRSFADTNKSAIAYSKGKSAKHKVNTSQSRSNVTSQSSATSPTEIVVSSPVSPMEEMKSTLKYGTVGKLIKDFKTTPLTGRLFDPSSLERNKKSAEGNTRKFKFAVEGIDVPVSPTSNASPVPNSYSPATPVPPGTVPPPPPISPEILNQIAAANSITTTSTPAADPSQTSAHPVPAAPVAPPPPPPLPLPDLNDGTPGMNSLEREKKRGFTYILDDKAVPVMKKRAEDVMARKPHETVEEQVHSKRSTDIIIKDNEVSTLREARAKLHKQERSPDKIMPSPPDYSTATLDSEAVIKVSGDAQKSSRNSQMYSASMQKSNEDSQIKTDQTQRASANIQINGSYQISGSETRRSNIDVQQTGVQIKADEKNNLEQEKQELNVGLNQSSVSGHASGNHISSVNITSVNVNASESSGVSQQPTNKEAGLTAAPPVSPVKSQRSPDSAYHSDAQSPGFDLGKTLAPSHSNIEITSSQEVTVQRAAIDSKPTAREAGQSSHSEARQTFQSETLQITGQSAGDSEAVRASIATSSSHRDLGPPKDTSSPLLASSYNYDGLLTTDNAREDIGLDRHTPRDNIYSHGTLPTELVSNRPVHSRPVSNIGEEQNGRFSVHIQPAQGHQRITVGGSQNSPAYSHNSYSQENYSSLPRSEGNYSQRQSTTSNRYHTTVSPRPSSREGHYGQPYRHLQGPSGTPGSRVVPLQPVSVDINLADRYSHRSPNTRHLQTIHGMSAMAGEVMQPFSQMSNAGGRHFDYTDGRYVAEQYNFSTYERSTGTKNYNGNGPTPDLDGNSSYNINSHSYNSNASPKRKYLKVDESRPNGRVPMYNGDLESYEYNQHGHRYPRYKMNSARTTDDVFEDDSIHSEPVYRHHQRHGMNSVRRMQKNNVMSRSQPHLNDLGHSNSLGEPLYVSVPHSPPRYGTLRSARSETMLAQHSPSADTTLLLPHLEDAKSKTRAKYPYHITLKLNQLAGSRPGSRPGSSHMSLQRSSRDGYYNSLQSERNQTQSLSGLYGSGKRPMHTSAVSLVNIELDPRSPTGQQPVRYREDGNYSRQEKYSYQQQDGYVFNGSLPGSHVENTQVIHANVGSPQKVGEKEFFLKIDNLPENERVNNNYIWKTSSSNQTNERVNKRQSNKQQVPGYEPDFTMAINQTMTMDYLPKKKKREEKPQRPRVPQYEEEMDLSHAENKSRYDNEIPLVQRKQYLIKNYIDTTSAAQHIDVVDNGDLDESIIIEHNTNVFDNRYNANQVNPGYVSDEEEEIYMEQKQQQRPAFTNIFETVETTNEEDVVDIPVSYTTTSHETSYSQQGNASSASRMQNQTGNASSASRMQMNTAMKPRPRMDRTDYEKRVTQSSSARQNSEPQMQMTTERVEITEYDLERLLKGAPPGSVKQTINVEREEEEIIGPLPITHADGEESAAEGLLNFDTVSEKVELGIVHGKAQLTVRVRCERVVPIRGVDDMFKKSSVIVTRLIDIDMEATRERRHLLDNIMAGSSRRTLNESTGQVRHSSQKTLNTKDTFQLYKTFMAMAEAEDGHETKGQMHVEKRLEDERGLPDHAEFDIRTEDVDERVFGEPVEMEFDTDDLERRLESQMMTNGITNGTRLEAMPNGRGHVVMGQDLDTVSFRSGASDAFDLVY